MESMGNNIEEQSSLLPPIKAIVVNGKKKIAINGVVNLDIPDVPKQGNIMYAIDDECLVIDVCRRLDISKLGDMFEVVIPDGYVADVRSYGANVASVYWTTYGSEPSSWSTNGEVTATVVRADTSEEATTNATISNYTTGSLSIATPFVKSYLKVEVTTACDGGAKPFAMFNCRIYCHKE